MPRDTAAIHKSIQGLDPAAWNALVPAAHPFMRHEFLSALEREDCIGHDTGWQPRYVTLSDAKGLSAAAAAYIKTHSYGEFVFDFSWARAYERIGRRYYPKLTVAVPFTPATGPRLLTRADREGPELTEQLLLELEQLAQRQGLSSVHALFIEEPLRHACEPRGWLLRRDCQFHWHNRDYGSFEDYLATFTAEKRKKARRERRRVSDAGVRFETRLGGQLDERLLDRIYELHRDTFLRHGHEPYLTRAFFGAIAQALPQALMVKLALHGRTLVAAAIFFVGGDTLYGRYWGAVADYHSLHFETCYHQGIEFCIEQRLKRFEPGTQGEHKVSRGFEPTLTWSAHYIADPQFREAIAHYLTQEGAAVEAYAHEVQSHVPYRGRRTLGQMA
jgi:predicted N-acyltransferase